MRNLIGKCLAMGFIAATFFNPAFAGTATEAELALIAGKLVRIDAAIAAGSCASCAGSLAVLQADLDKLSGPRVGELKARIAALDAKLDAAPKLTANQVVSDLRKEFGPMWEAAARKVSNTCSIYVEALTIGGLGDAQVLKALADSVTECAEQGKIKEALANAVCINGGVVKTNTMTVICDAPKFPTQVVNPAALAPPPPPSSSRTVPGWVLSGLGGATAFGLSGWWIGNKAGPVRVTDTGIDWGMGPPVALVGTLVGAVVGGAVYYVLTAEK